MIDSDHDVYDTVEEMYGMIWSLATNVSMADGMTPEEAVEIARKSYREGLRLSPGIQKPHKEVN
jgi:hypothetical protein